MELSLDRDMLKAKFYLIMEPHPDAIYSASFAELSTVEGMKKFLQFYAPLLTAPDTEPAGTFFCSWLGRIALAEQYYLSFYNRSIALDLENLTMDMYESNGYCQFAFRIQQWSEEQGTGASAEREIFRQTHLKQLYQQTLRPLIEAISTVTGAHARVFWRQFPSQFNYFIQAWQEEASSTTIVEQIKEDHHYVTTQMEAETFGLSRNPLHIPTRYTTSIQGDQSIPLKSACCLYHRMDDGDYCFSCPKLSETDRDERRLAYQSKEGN
ncbi:(2Fe-2S)-binding protein [Paenibacillus kyungheensis]